MTKYAYEYGKRWHVETPRYAIGRFVDRQHVGMSIDALETEINRAIDASKDAAKYTPAIRRECLDYAKRRHAKNFLLYAYAMGGR
jgi:hypothetical protein